MAEDRNIIHVKMVVIGGSAGSLSVLLYLLPRLRKNFSIPITIVLHRAASNDNILAQLLSTKTRLKVKEIDEKESPMPGHIYIAPPNYHLLMEKDNSFSLDYSEKINYSRPSIDVTFQSASDVYNNTLVCILLSGANADGAEGLKQVQALGGSSIVQTPATAEVPHMPEQAILTQKPDYIFSPQEMVDYLNALP
jgi:two-component system, chemotaxis family, protein-glutamate methylesterase/glutaminase